MSEANRDLPDERRIDLRIEVHVGDAVVYGEDLHGDAGNLAARLQKRTSSRVRRFILTLGKSDLRALTRQTRQTRRSRNLRDR
jgi:class 3 adenylate cyclase